MNEVEASRSLGQTWKRTAEQYARLQRAMLRFEGNMSKDEETAVCGQIHEAVVGLVTELLSLAAGASVVMYRNGMWREKPKG
jgi:hypothetical protein